MFSDIKLRSPDQKSDRRVQRTKLALRRALVELIQEKGYDILSVEEITQRANLGRATFYLHYKDKDDLLLEEFNERVSDQVRLISAIPLSYWNPEIQPDKGDGAGGTIRPMSMIFEHAAENADFYRVILKGESTKRVAKRINEIIIQSYNEVIESKFPEVPQKMYQDLKIINLLAVFFSGALLSCIAWWLDQDPLPSPEVMSAIFQNMYVPGVKRVINEIRAVK